MAGDHCQLPPTVISDVAAEKGLKQTLFERLLLRPGPRISRMLDVQYRMHDAICRWASAALYDGRLKTHPSCQSHRLCDMAGVRDTEETRTPLWLIDTAGCDMAESIGLADGPALPLRADGADADGSRSNDGEARVLAAHLRRLQLAGVRDDDVCVITPYNAQVQLLRMQLRESHPRLEIGSVDGMQGREKEAVLLTLVRSNEAHEVGFLADDRRINVAVTRARRHVCLVCDSETIRAHPFLRVLLDHFFAHGEVRSAAEYDAPT